MKIPCSGCDVFHFLEALAGRSAGLFQVVIRLQSHPELFRGTQGARQTQGSVRRDRPLAKHRKFLEEQMEKFFFGEGAETPPDYKPQQ